MERDDDEKSVTDKSIGAKNQMRKSMSRKTQMYTRCEVGIGPLSTESAIRRVSYPQEMHVHVLKTSMSWNPNGSGMVYYELSTDVCAAVREAFVIEERYSMDMGPKGSIRL